MSKVYIWRELLLLWTLGFGGVLVFECVNALYFAV